MITLTHTSNERVVEWQRKLPARTNSVRVSPTTKGIFLDRDHLRSTDEPISSLTAAAGLRLGRRVKTTQGAASLNSYCREEQNIYLMEQVE